MIDGVFLFLLAAVALTVSPGPDQIYIVSRTLAEGRLVGFASSWGVCTGTAFHVLAAAFGFSVIIKSSVNAHSLLKYAGAAYLVWLAVQAFRQKTISADTIQGTRRKESLFSAYFQGVIIDVCNPKVALFFLAFLPQFIPADASHPAALFILLGGVTIFLGLVWEAVLIFLADRFLSGLLHRPGLVRYGNNIMVWILVGLALNVIFSDDNRPAEPSHP